MVSYTLLVFYGALHGTFKFGRVYKLLQFSHASTLPDTTATTKIVRFFR